MNKHAYLIMAHNQFGLLKKLITALDHELNDIYVHIDIKAGKIDIEEFQACVIKSGLYFVDRMSITWAGESQIKGQLLLFREATKVQYQYYHLISGVDFPIKSQTYIHEFFDKHNGQEFIEYWDRQPKEYLFRIKYYYPLQEKIGRYTYDAKTLCLRVASKCLIGWQKIKKVNRLMTYDGEFKIGANWVSISHELAKYMIEHEDDIQRIFFQGVAADELVLQTLCWNSSFKKNIYQGSSTRLIDWKRGTPYTWTEEDFNEIKKSSALFVRKVSEENGLVNKICQELLE